MAYVTTTSKGLTLAQRIANLRADLGQRMARRAVYRDTARELGALTDRELADLGIARADISHVARKAAEAA